MSETDRSPETMNKAFKRACIQAGEKNVVQLRKDVKDLTERMNRASKTVGELLNRLDEIEERLGSGE